MLLHQSHWAARGTSGPSSSAIASKTRQFGISVSNGRPSGKGNRQVFCVVLGTPVENFFVMLLDHFASWRLSYCPLSVSYLAALLFFSISIAVSVVMYRWCSETDSNRQYRIRSAKVCPVSLSERIKGF